MCLCMSAVCLQKKCFQFSGAFLMGSGGPDMYGPDYFMSQVCLVLNQLFVYILKQLFVYISE